MKMAPLLIVSFVGTLHSICTDQESGPTCPKRWSGSSVLSSIKRGKLIHTDYFFGPNRDPVLRLLQSTDVRPEELQVSGKWTSRITRFTMLKSTLFEWSYAKEKRVGKHVNLIILRVVDIDGQGKEPTNGRIVAKLARGEDTRTPGTSRCRAGNGGELQIDENAVFRPAGGIRAHCNLPRHDEARDRLAQGASIRGYWRQRWRYNSLFILLPSILLGNRG